ncbi:MAG TPA: O-antigen ligase family protein [Acidimicrobiales bacterium]|nr:O-antigen ligase family protein [Acidimicrobiales bacterium]
MQVTGAWVSWKRASKQEDLFVFISRGLLYVGMFFLPLLRFKATKGLNVSDAIFLLGFVFLVLARKPPPRAPRTPAWFVGAFIFLLAGMLASTQADAVPQSVVVVFNAVYVFFILQYLLRQQLGTTLHLQRAIGFFIAGVSLSGFVAILQVTLHVFLPKAGSIAAGSGTIGGNARAVGLSNQPNLAGICFALGIILGVGLLLQIGWRRHWYLSCCVFVTVAALLLAASVSGMAAVIVGLLVLFIARGVPLKTVVSVVLALAAVYLLVFGVIDRGSKLDPITRVEKTTNANAGTGGGTLQLRIDTIDKAWSEILQKPITGHGLDQQTLAVYYDQSLYVYYPPHNLIALYWYGGGIFMVVGLVIMTGSGFSRLLRGRIRAGKNWDPMRDVVLAACVADLFFAMQSPELVDRWFWLPFLLALTFRDDAPPQPTTADAIEVPDTAPQAPAQAASGQPRRVSGSVGRHAASESAAADTAPHPRGRHVASSRGAT